jgi:hypothetical protein
VIGEKSRLHQLRRQKPVVYLHGGLPNEKLFREPATFESHKKPIALVSTDKIAAADIGLLESEAHGCLTAVPKKPAQFSEPVHSAWAKAELLAASLTGNVNAEITKAVVAVKA